MVKVSQYNNLFNIYLSSADAMLPPSAVADTFKGWRFNIRSVLDLAPNALAYNDCAYCLVNMKYFAIKQTPAQFHTDDTQTILVKLSGQYPNNIASSIMVAGNPEKNFVTQTCLVLLDTSQTATIKQSAGRSDVQRNLPTNVGNLLVGMKIEGPGIPADTTITAIAVPGTGTSITLSNAATATGTIVADAKYIYTTQQGNNLNVQTSNIIACVPTNATSATGVPSATYSNNSDNEKLIVSNIFKGDIEIELLQQDNSTHVANLSAATPWSMLLSVEFQAKDEQNYSSTRASKSLGFA